MGGMDLYDCTGVKPMGRPVCGEVNEWMELLVAGKVKFVFVAGGCMSGWKDQYF